MNQSVKYLRCVVLCVLRLLVHQYRVCKYLPSTKIKKSRFWPRPRRYFQKKNLLNVTNRSLGLKLTCIKLLLFYVSNTFIVVNRKKRLLTLLVMKQPRAKYQHSIFRNKKNHKFKLLDVLK